MADTKISELTAVTALALDDELVISDTSDATPSTKSKKATPAQIIGLIPGFRGALVYKTADQAISTGTVTDLTWNTESYDTDSIHESVTNPERLTVPAGVTKVILRGNVEWQSNNVGSRQLTMQKGGAAFIGSGATELVGNDATLPEQNVVSAIVTVVATNFFTLRVEQNTGANLNIIHGSGFKTWFSMEIIE